MKAYLLLLSMIFTVTALANSVRQPIPPVFIKMARCDVDEPYADKVSFDIYIDMSLIGKNKSLENVPGAIVQSGVPFFSVKMLFTTARVTISALDIEPIKLKAIVGEDTDELLILQADLFKVDDSYTGNGMGELGAKGSMSLKCTLG